MLFSILVFYYAQLAQKNYQPDIIRDYAVAESRSANLTIEQQNEVLSVIKGESNFDPTVVNPNDKGCVSAGLVQIRLCNHDISESQAKDPVFAVNFLIQNIDKCQTWWRSTCFTKSL